ncbi:MAG: hypothetical protein ACI4C1_04480 [Lachnospiraceae bacterium]
MKKKKLPLWKRILTFGLDAGVIIGVIVVIGDLLEKIWAWCQLDLVEAGSEEALEIQEALANSIGWGGYIGFVIFVAAVILIHKWIKVPFL